MQGMRSTPSQDDCSRAVDAVVDAYGRVDVLVNVAGIVGERAPFTDISLDVVRQVIDTNLMGSIYMGQLVARHMVGKTVTGTFFRYFLPVSPYDTI